MATSQQLQFIDQAAAKVVSQEYVPNATYPKKPKSTRNLVGAAIDMILASAHIGPDGMPLRCGRTVAIQGTHGTGKTSSAKAGAAERGLGAVYLSAPVIEITNLYISFPHKLTKEQRTKVETILHQLFHQDRPWLLIIDDFRRVAPSAQGAMFELMNEGSLAGQKLRGHVGTLLIDNPAGDGYQGVGGGDPAFETRFRTVEMDANDTPWREALAAKYATTNLTKLFESWARWDPQVRRTVNPRVLDHLIAVTLEGLPPEVGLPILPSGRQKVLDAAGNDRTEAVLKEVADCLEVPFRERVDNVVGRSLAAALRHGWNVHIVGPHGVGKTAYILSYLEAEGAEGAYLSMAHRTPSDMLVTVPTREGGIELIPNEELIADGDTPKVIILDEGFRAAPAVRGQMLEITQERSLGGVPLGARSVIMINNPAKWGEFTYPIGKADEAMCSRFVINLFVTEEMIPWKDHLRATYGDDMVIPFLEWRANNLEEVERAICCPRVMESLILTHLYNLGVSDPGNRVPLDSALPMGADGKRIGIRLHDLIKRLEGSLVLGFSRIVADYDEVLSRLQSNPADEAEVSMKLNLELEVTRALQITELFLLEEHRDKCKELVRALSQSNRIAVFRKAKDGEDSEDRQIFWARIATEMNAENKSKADGSDAG